MYLRNDIVTLNKEIEGIEGRTFKIRAFVDDMYYLKSLDGNEETDLQLLKHLVSKYDFVGGEELTSKDFRVIDTEDGIEFQIKVNNSWEGIFCIFDGTISRRTHLDELGVKGFKLDHLGRARFKAIG